MFFMDLYKIGVSENSEVTGFVNLYEKIWNYEKGRLVKEFREYMVFWESEKKVKSVKKYDRIAHFA